MIQCATNPLFLFLAVWGTALVLYLSGVHTGLFGPGVPQATGAVLLNVAAFSLGYLTWSLLEGPKMPGSEIPALGGPPLTPRRLKASLNLTLLFGLIAVGFCVLRIVILSQAVGIDLSRVLAKPILCRKIIAAPIAPAMYDVRLCTIAITLAGSIFSLGFVLLGILLYFGRGWRRYGLALLFLLVSLSIGLLSLARQEVTINVLFVVLSYLFLHHWHRLRRGWAAVGPLLVPLAALIVLFVLIDLLLRKSQIYRPQNRLHGFFFSVYWYLASPLGAFAEYVRRGDHTLTLGQSLLLPFYKWLARLDLVPATSKTVLTDWLHIPYAANVFTYLREIHEDFGFAGVAVVPYGLGALSTVLRRHAGGAFPCLNLYLILLVVLIFSVYSYLLVSSQFYLQAAFALLFLNYDLRFMIYDLSLPPQPTKQKS